MFPLDPDLDDLPPELRERQGPFFVLAVDPESGEVSGAYITRDQLASAFADRRRLAVTPGYAFIQVPGCSDVFCPGRKFGDLVMTSGLNIRFELGFTPRGPIALEPRAVRTAEATSVA